MTELLVPALKDAAIRAAQVVAAPERDPQPDRSLQAHHQKMRELERYSGRYPPARGSARDPGERGKHLVILRR